MAEVAGATTTRRWFALASIVLLAGALRFAGIGWGLRHEPLWDERVFVESVAEMIENHDLDHRYYEYPGLFFYLLLPVLKMAGVSKPPDATAYVVARALGAAVGALNCAVLYALGSRLASPRAGLLAAALLAVSPLGVRTAHMVRPDSVLQALVLLGLWAVTRVGDNLKDDARAGAAVGLAAGLKFTGALVAVPYAVQRILKAGPRWRGMALAAIAATAVFFFLTPYAVLHAREFLGGVGTQVGYHFEERPAGPVPYARMLEMYAGVWLGALGVPAALFAVVGLIRVLGSDPRRWLPLIALPLTTLLVMAAQEYRFDRHMLPSLGVPILLAAVAAEFLAPKAIPFALLSALMALQPFLASTDDVRAYVRPGTRDRALDWVVAHLSDGARVAVSVPRLTLPGDRFEVLSTGFLDAADRGRLVEMDYVVSGPRDVPAALEGLNPVYLAEDANELAGPRIAIFEVPPSARTPYRDVSLDGARLTASENAADAGLAADGRLDTAWTTPSRQRALTWFDVELKAPVRLGRVELRLGDSWKHEARELVVAVGESEGDLKATPARAARPAAAAQHVVAGYGFSQVLVLTPPRVARRIRLQLARNAGHRWGIAELRLGAVVGP